MCGDIVDDIVDVIVDDILDSILFLLSQESVLAVAGDEEVVRFFDCDSLMCLSEFKAHENRYFFH